MLAGYGISRGLHDVSDRKLACRNYPGDRDVGFGTKAWKTGMDRIYLPFYRSFMIKDKGERIAQSPQLSACSHFSCILSFSYQSCIGTAGLLACLRLGLYLRKVLSAGLYAEAVGRIFKEWDFDSILPCHGDYVARDGKRILQEHLELMGERKRLISP